MKDNLPQFIISGISSAGILIMVFILFFLFREASGVLSSISLKEILLGTLWYPAENPPVLGMLPLIVGTLAVTALTSLIALPSVSSAVFVSEIAPRVSAKSRSLFSNF
ncbi:hypothetical protein MASR2M17_09480 [Aminivibrio sp.]